MSIFVLKREYALQLPNSYVEIDRDEMEYVDGGGWAETIVGSIIAGAVLKILGVFITDAMIKSAAISLGGWVLNTFYTACYVATINPWATGVALSIAAVIGYKAYKIFFK